MVADELDYTLRDGTPFVVRGYVDLSNPDDPPIAEFTAWHGDNNMGAIRLELSPPRAWISGLAVDRLWQDRGLGRILFNLAKSAAKKGGYTQLLVISDNSAVAKKFYLANGGLRKEDPSGFDKFSWNL